MNSSLASNSLTYCVSVHKSIRLKWRQCSATTRYFKHSDGESASCIALFVICQSSLTLPDLQIRRFDERNCPLQQLEILSALVSFLIYI